jgi:hypothetical protein
VQLQYTVNTNVRIQADQTINGDYERIQYHMFQASKENRCMRWKAGTGRIATGGASYNTDADNMEGKNLPAGQAIVVYATYFRLSKT